MEVGFWGSPDEENEEESSLWLITYSYNVGVSREPFLLFIFGGHNHLMDRQQTKIGRTTETLMRQVFLDV